MEYGHTNVCRLNISMWVTNDRTGSELLVSDVPVTWSITFQVHLPSASSGLHSDIWVSQCSGWPWALVWKYSATKYRKGGLLNKNCNSAYKQVAIVPMVYFRQGSLLCLGVPQALHPQDGARATGKSSCSPATITEACLGSEPLMSPPAFLWPQSAPSTTTVIFQPLIHSIHIKQLLHAQSCPRH